MNWKQIGKKKMKKIYIDVECSRSINWECRILHVVRIGRWESRGKVGSHRAVWAQRHGMWCPVCGMECSRQSRKVLRAHMGYPPSTGGNFVKAFAVSLPPLVGALREMNVWR